MPVDWTALKTDFLHHPQLTYAALAKKHGGNEQTIRSRACREKWPRERRRRATVVQHVAIEKAVFDAAAELAHYNEQDLLAAKALRSIAARRLQDKDLQATEIRALAAAIESAQRVARLALGASTQNMTETVDLYSMFDFGRLSDVELAAAEQLLGKAMGKTDESGELERSDIAIDPRARPM